ncbi:MAG: hypothetical protein KGI10_04235 [Thaumarchaeota archaeon]|nr:hypothetical protein [Nitrososphaerota archaeon]
MMESSIIVDDVVTINPTVGNKTNSGVKDILLSMSLLAKFKNADLNII